MHEYGAPGNRELFFLCFVAWISMQIPSVLSEAGGHAERVMREREADTLVIGTAISALARAFDLDRSSLPKSCAGFAGGICSCMRGYARPLLTFCLMAAALVVAARGCISRSNNMSELSNQFTHSKDNS